MVPGESCRIGLVARLCGRSSAHHLAGDVVNASDKWVVYAAARSGWCRCVGVKHGFGGGWWWVLCEDDSVLDNICMCCDGCGVLVGFSAW